MFCTVFFKSAQRISSLHGIYSWLKALYINLSTLNFFFHKIIFPLHCVLPPSPQIISLMEDWILLWSVHLSFVWQFSVSVEPTQTELSYNGKTSKTHEKKRATPIPSPGRLPGTLPWSRDSGEKTAGLYPQLYCLMEKNMWLQIKQRRK